MWKLSCATFTLGGLYKHKISSSKINIYVHNWINQKWDTAFNIAPSNIRIFNWIYTLKFSDYVVKLFSGLLSFEENYPF